MWTIAIIPARLDSQRLPRKLLLSETGKPLIQHVYESVAETFLTYVATPDREIEDAILAFGGNVIGTGAHAKGTDRVASAASILHPSSHHHVINVQGDCPMSPIQAKFALNHIDMLLHTHEIATTIYADGRSDHTDRNRVKVVVDNNMMALYFSRHPIPYNATTRFIHNGIYGFRYETLEKISTEGPGCRNIALMEDLEQVQWMENGHRIKCIVTEKFPSIDTRDDYDLFKESYLSGKWLNP